MQGAGLLLGLLFGPLYGHSSPGHRERVVPQRGAWWVRVLFNLQMPGYWCTELFLWMNQNREADAGLVVRTLTWWPQTLARQGSLAGPSAVAWSPTPTWCRPLFLPELKVAGRVCSLAVAARPVAWVLVHLLPSSPSRTASVGLCRELGSLRLGLRVLAQCGVGTRPAFLVEVLRWSLVWRGSDACPAGAGLSVGPPPAHSRTGPWLCVLWSGLPGVAGCSGGGLVPFPSFSVAPCTDERKVLLEG